jgi:hypothetical protein
VIDQIRLRDGPQTAQTITSPCAAAGTASAHDARSMTCLDDLIGILSAALARSAERDDAKAQAEVRQAANTAMDAIDAHAGRGVRRAADSPGRALAPA